MQKNNKNLELGKDIYEGIAIGLGLFDFGGAGSCKDHGNNRGGDAAGAQLNVIPEGTEACTRAETRSPETHTEKKTSDMMSRGVRGMALQDNNNLKTGDIPGTRAKCGGNVIFGKKQNGLRTLKRAGWSVTEVVRGKKWVLKGPHSLLFIANKCVKRNCGEDVGNVLYGSLGDGKWWRKAWKRIPRNIVQELDMACFLEEEDDVIVTDDWIALRAFTVGNWEDGEIVYLVLFEGGLSLWKVGEDEPLTVGHVFYLSDEESGIGEIPDLEPTHMFVKLITWTDDEIAATGPYSLQIGLEIPVTWQSQYMEGGYNPYGNQNRMLSMMGSIFSNVGDSQEMRIVLGQTSGMAVADLGPLWRWLLKGYVVIYSGDKNGFVQIRRNIGPDYVPTNGLGDDHVFMTINAATTPFATVNIPGPWEDNDFQIYWFAPKYQITLIIRRAVTRLEGSFNPYGNEQPGVYIVWSDVWKPEGLQLDYQGGVYIKFQSKFNNYVQELKKATFSSQEDMFFGSYLAKEGGIEMGKGTVTIEAKPGKNNKVSNQGVNGGGGYDRSKLPPKPREDRVAQLQKTFHTIRLACEGYWDGKYNYSMFEDIVAGYDKSSVSEAFLRAAKKSQSEALTVMLRTDSPVTRLFRKVHANSRVIPCDALGMEMDDEDDLGEEQARPKYTPESKVGVFQMKDGNCTKLYKVKANNSNQPTDGKITPDKEVEPAPQSKNGEQSVSIIRVRKDGDGEITQAEKKLDTLQVTKDDWKRISNLQSDELRRAALGELIHSRVKLFFPKHAGLLTSAMLDSGWEYHDIFDLILDDDALHRQAEKLRTALVEPEKKVNYVTEWEKLLCHHAEYVVSDVKDAKERRRMCRSAIASLLRDDVKICKTLVEDPEVRENVFSMVDTDYDEDVLADSRAAVDRILMTYGSSDMTKGNSQLADSVNDIPESSTATEVPYTPYPRADDGGPSTVYEHYPRLDEQYQPYPKAGPEAHWSKDAAEKVFGKNNYIGKGWTAGGKRNAKGEYDYSVPALSWDDAIAKVHDALLEKADEPRATEILTGLTGDSWVSRALQLANFLNMTTLCWFIMFFEGGFNPYGNGQTEVVKTSRVIQMDRDITPIAKTQKDVMLLMAKLLKGGDFVAPITPKGNWVRESSLHQADTTSYVRMPLVHYTHEQIDFGNYYQINNYNEIALVGNPVTNVVTLTHKRPSPIDGISYKDNTVVNESVMKLYSQAPTYRELNALVNQNQFFNPIALSTLMPLIPKIAAGETLTMTKLFLYFMRYTQEDQDPIPTTTYDAHTIYNPHPDIANAAYIGTDTSPRAMFVWPANVDAAYVNSTDAVNILAKRSMQNYVAGPILNWLSTRTISTDLELAVIPLYPGFDNLDPLARILWVLVHMAYGWDRDEYDLGRGMARWSHTAGLVHITGPKTKVLFVNYNDADMRFLIPCTTLAGAVTNPSMADANYGPGPAAAGATLNLNNATGVGDSMFLTWTLSGRDEKIDAIMELLGALPQWVTDTEYMFGFYNAIAHGIRLGPDMWYDASNLEFSFASVGVHAHMQPNNKYEMPGQTLSGLIPNDILDINNLTDITESNGEVGAPMPLELIMRCIGAIVPEGQTTTIVARAIADHSILDVIYSQVTFEMLRVFDTQNKLALKMPRSICIDNHGWAENANNQLNPKIAQAKMVRSMMTVNAPRNVQKSSIFLSAATNAEVAARHDLAQNMGLYSGTDLWLLGLAAPEEIRDNFEMWVGFTDLGNTHVISKNFITADWFWKSTFCLAYNPILNTPAPTMWIVSPQDRIAAQPTVLCRAARSLVFDRDGMVTSYANYLDDTRRLLRKGWNIPMTFDPTFITDMTQYRLWIDYADFLIERDRIARRNYLRQESSAEDIGNNVLLESKSQVASLLSDMWNEREDVASVNAMIVLASTGPGVAGDGLNVRQPESGQAPHTKDEK